MNQRLRFGDYILDPLLQRVTCAGAIVPLKPKTFDLLCLLLANRERVVPKDELLDWLWPRQVVSEANLSQAVYELRRALGDTARPARWIRNVPRRGYGFAGEVTPAEEALDSLRAALDRGAAVPALGATDDGAHLGLGIADAIITRLARAGGMVVRPLSAVARFVAPGAGCAAAGRRLEVDCVVEGTIQLAAGQLRASGRLLRVADGACLWADGLTLPAEEVFEVQDRLAAGVVAATVQHPAPVQRRSVAARPGIRRFTACT
jgi:DNA-binding winged helix-turn-helix (wHTH) protein/TolB-like protein